MKNILKELFSILENIKETTICNNQLIGFIIRHNTPKHEESIEIPPQDIKPIRISNKQLNYMLENDITLTQWGDA